ncbi:GmrSD restriction endonuclease domain-containing protein [Mycoplasmopsis verecunda]|uniref:GmrSD restriction endonucleases N-terminal domain-containing protein n=1 Tax=Mycoplasmopsis verecunda TaxID=171291 RepID=A0A1T4LK26_9BACT|nr:DUF262 domain-containing protein [Mycoplasmopsis verecunda]WPB54428.1 DUF262 domain-containing protein [Mycoplasmopsis verecunda]SJZ55103.1 Protein of unknown function DUF262 [Mycoplasmopsis verecunda]
MTTDNKKITEFIGIPDRQFIIPVYQRRYSWDLSQYNRLWNDLLNINKYNKASHFLGSIVASANDQI